MYIFKLDVISSNIIVLFVFNPLVIMSEKINYYFKQSRKYPAFLDSPPLVSLAVLAPRAAQCLEAF